DAGAARLKRIDARRRGCRCGASRIADREWADLQVLSRIEPARCSLHARAADARAAAHVHAEQPAADHLHVDMPLTDPWIIEAEIVGRVAPNKGERLTRSNLPR